MDRLVAKRLLLRSTLKKYVVLRNCAARQGWDNLAKRYAVKVRQTLHRSVNGSDIWRHTKA